MVEWVELDELLDKNIGDIRAMLAHEDSDSSFRTFLIENGWIVDENFEDEESYEDDWETEEEDDDIIELPSDQEKLAQDIAEDINKNKYTLNNIRGLYSDEFFQRVIQFID